MAAVRESLWTAGWGGQQQGSAAWLRIWLLDLSVLEEGGERAALLVAASNQNDQVSQVPNDEAVILWVYCTGRRLLPPSSTCSEDR